MAFFWKQEVKIIEIHKRAFTIEAHIVDHSQHTDWWLIGIYASCDVATRKNQWKVLNERKRLWGQRWIVAGDFNDIVSNEEQWGGRRREEWTFRDFKQFIADNELIDVGFDGNPWTWCNNWKMKEKLNKGWIECFVLIPGSRFLTKQGANMSTITAQIIV